MDGRCTLVARVASLSMVLLEALLPAPAIACAGPLLSGVGSNFVCRDGKVFFIQGTGRA